MDLESKSIVFFDGNCGVCHFWVRFTVTRDGGKNFLFAPIGGSTFKAVVGETPLPDSMILRDGAGKLLSRSAAVISILKQLRGTWRVLGNFLSIVPKGIADVAYSVVAKLRLRLASKPQSTCPIVEPKLRQFFLD